MQMATAVQSQQRRKPLTKEQREFICYHLSLLPPTSSADIGRLAAELFDGLVITEDDCTNCKRRSYGKKLIEEIRSNPRLRLELSQKFGSIVLTDFINQLKFMQRIAEQSFEGYEETVGSASGEAVKVNRKDFRTTIYALREIRRIMQETGISATQDVSSFTVTVKTVMPTEDSDDEGWEDAVESEGNEGDPL